MNRQQLIDTLWFGHDPFTHVAKNLYEYDLQGWRSVHEYLLDTIRYKSPEIVIEIGVWKGASVESMASLMKELGRSSTIIAVDTWLGAVDHWLNPGTFNDLSFQGGYPALFSKFANNIIRSELTEYIVPLPLDSINAAELILARGVQADLIHLDAGHEYRSVYSDLEAWWPCLKSGGAFVGDDYDPEGQSFPGVVRAFDEFFAKFGIADITHLGGKCIIVKP